MTNLNHTTYCGCPECAKEENLASMTTPRWKVMRVKQLLVKKAQLDKEIDDLMENLTHQGREELYKDNLYFPKERIYKT